MAALKQIRVRWTGLPTGEGISTFYVDNGASTPMSSLRTFFSALGTSLPGAITIKFPTVGNIIDVATGDPIGTWTNAAVTDVTGSGGSTFAAMAGAVVNWKTGVYLAGRQMTGKTFLVPLAPVCFDGSGGVAAATRTAIDSAAATLLTAAPQLSIYSKARRSASTILTGATSPIAAQLASRKR